jgi:heme-degrading monooxygenase HmoA
VSVVKINAIEVPAGQGAELERRFAGRARLVEGMPGFEGFELLRPVSGDDRYFVLTHWADEQSFRAWVESTEFRQGHAQADASDGQPVATHSALLEFEVVELVGPPD